MNEHHNQFNHFIGYYVKVTYPNIDIDTMEGLLLDINKDHLVLKSDNGLVHYIQIDKIRGLTKNTKDITPEDIRDIPYTDSKRFYDLLKEYETNWVKLTREGIRFIKGFISEVFPTHLIFIVKDEISLIPLSQISFLSTKKTIQTEKPEMTIQYESLEKEKVKNDVDKKPNIYHATNEEKTSLVEEKQKDERKREQDNKPVEPKVLFTKINNNDDDSSKEEDNDELEQANTVVYKSPSKRKKKRIS